ncbi:hypothetical protein KD985_05260 [Treponema pallidum]|uniref:hypothetical protein n=1 Tax=Treponema pallidum TaxID=160 RepID=UPI0002EE9F90|nr:hypothetical protein [Treponema pallidum]UNQ69589.1 hypothetical protein KD985_05260 [Treponema pallidum]UZW07885.1 hypothetical protein OSA53_02505 [Treponema pallidum]WBF88625.1 hypothetical protein KEB12_05375 [Treponema pallidum]WBO94127.1 hypothetical protein O9187_02495 [Treponema pallidum]WBP10115.1 hypothetical protein O9165_02635 [Treponema pallidum]
MRENWYQRSVLEGGVTLSAPAVVTGTCVEAAGVGSAVRAQEKDSTPDPTAHRTRARRVFMVS